MNIADNIKAVRKAKGITPTFMAKQLGIEVTNYPRLENRGNQLTYSNLEKISNALGLTVIELLTWGDEKEIEVEPRRDVNVNTLRERVKELEKQVALYDENRAYKAEADERKATIFYYTIDCIIWDIAYNYNIISQEEAERYGAVAATTVKSWMVDAYWVNENDEHPYAVNVLPEKQLDQALNILFSLVWARNIINQILNDEWFSSKLSEWEYEGGEGDFPGKNAHKIYYTYKGVVPEL